MSDELICYCCEQNKDKSAWGPGAWQDEPDRFEFKAHGFPCILHRNHQGAWCGYVGLPPGHKFHGKDYDDTNVSVHGGLTYAKKCDGHVCHVAAPGEPEDVWWLGFDCHHAFDHGPAMEARLRELRDYPLSNNHYWTMAEARQETESLAAQLRSA